MAGRKIVYGLLDISAAIHDLPLARKCRELTLAWMRYDYHGSVIEHASVDEIVSQAADGGYRYCLILAYGQIVHEQWKPGEAESGGFAALLRKCFLGLEGMVAGNNRCVTQNEVELDHRCLLVDLQLYADWDRPAFGHAGRGYISASQRHGLPVTELPEKLQARLVDLEPEAGGAPGMREMLSDGAGEADLVRAWAGADPGQHDFLRVVHEQTAHARHGVFLLNIESHGDVATPHEEFTGPVSSLYCVASGFKPNRILQTHGMSADSRVVYFDYSANALAVRKAMVEDWNGEDFPRFIRGLFERFPAPDTYYQLWSGATPDNIDWRIVERLWRDQLDQMGGAKAFLAHWRDYRRLAHEYIHCDLLGDPRPLLDRIVLGSGALIWFSNAPFTMYANWRYTFDERRRMYRHWIERLAELNPELLLYGSDYTLDSCSLYQQQIRM
jgi:hypothetical protein